MGADSKIEWTDHTFNPWIGCTKISPGCDHCYAKAWADRYRRDVWGPKKPRQRTSASNWRLPYKWDAAAKAAGRPAFVFTASLADVFDNEANELWRAELLDLIAATPNLRWLVLTKRVGNVLRLLGRYIMEFGVPVWPPNAWLGATIVNQEEADRDIPKLLQAKQRLGIPRVFLSMEPLLSGVVIPPEWLAQIDWIIVGGESGANARPMHPDWARSLRDQCQAAGVPFLFKQWGEWFPYGEFDGEGKQNSCDRGERPGLWHTWEQPLGGFSVRLLGGKKAAGRLLDGVEHNGRPQA